MLAPNSTRENHTPGVVHHPGLSYVPDSYRLCSLALANRAVMILTRSPRSVYPTTSSRPADDIPILTNRNSASEWSGSAMVSSSGSPNTASAPFHHSAERQKAASALRFRLTRVEPHSNLRNSSLVNPTSRTMLPIVIAFTGLWRGIVITRLPSVMTICLPWRAIRKPNFSNARTASR